MTISFAGEISPPGMRGNHRVGAVPLEVGQEVIVGVLQRRLLALQDVPTPEARENAGDHRLADVAAAAETVLGDKSAEGGDLLDAHDVEEVGTRKLGEMLAQAMTLGHPRRREHLLQQRHAAPATRAGAGTGFQRRHVGTSLPADGVVDGVGGDTRAGTDLCRSDRTGDLATGADQQSLR